MEGSIAGEWADAELAAIDAWEEKKEKEKTKVKKEGDTSAPEEEEDDDEEEEEVEAREPSITGLIVRFKKTFRPLDRQGKAQTEIETIKMTGDLAEIDKFILAFDKSARISGLDDKALLLFFKRALPSTLVDNISGIFPQPKGLEEYKKRAVLLQNKWLKQ